MTAPWMLAVKPGDWLTPIPLWNDTALPRRLQLPSPCQVLEVQKTSSQSGIVCSVRTLTGAESSFLDVAWFEPVTQA